MAVDPTTGADSVFERLSARGGVVKVVEGPKGAVPEIVKIYPREVATPDCGKTTFST